MRILPEVLQDDMEAGHVVVLTVHILHGHIGGHLGEGLQQLGEGQVVASRRRLHQKYLMVYFKIFLVKATSASSLARTVSTGP